MAKAQQACDPNSAEQEKRLRHAKGGIVMCLEILVRLRYRKEDKQGNLKVMQYASRKDQK
jgi:hypothetical protein